MNFPADMDDVTKKHYSLFHNLLKDVMELQSQADQKIREMAAVYTAINMVNSEKRKNLEAREENYRHIAFKNSTKVKFLKSLDKYSKEFNSDTTNNPDALTKRVYETETLDHPCPKKICTNTKNVKTAYPKKSNTKESETKENPNAKDYSKAKSKDKISNEVEKKAERSNSRGTNLNVQTETSDNNSEVKSERKAITQLIDKLCNKFSQSLTNEEYNILYPWAEEASKNSSKKSNLGKELMYVSSNHLSNILTPKNKKLLFEKIIYPDEIISILFPKLFAHMRNPDNDSYYYYCKHCESTSPNKIYTTDKKEFALRHMCGDLNLKYYRCTICDYIGNHLQTMYKHYSLTHGLPKEWYQGNNA